MSAGVRLHYELRGSPSAPAKAVLLMGAFATLRHFDALADALAAAGIEVLTYDHRGVGDSRTSDAAVRALPQSSALLAADARALLEGVWPAADSAAAGARSLHIYGASMGGMVAQRLALELLRAPLRALPLRSLTLAMTARGYGLARFLPLGAGFYRAVLPLALASTPAAIVDSLLAQMFTAEYLATPHAGAAGAAQGATTMGALWRARWTAEFSLWFSLADLDATAAQAPVAARHYLTDAELAALRDAAPPLPILVVIAERDALIAPAAQRALAGALRARTLVQPDGHVGSVAGFRALCDAVAENMLRGREEVGVERS